MNESTNKPLSLKMTVIYIVTTIVAFCSILYEFLLAQSLSSVLGNTIFRYNVTIGLYVASMGFGALYFSKKVYHNPFELFIKVEFWLALIGFLSSFLVLIADSVIFNLSNYFSLHFHSAILQVPLNIFLHLLIIAIGFLSGFELPLLMSFENQFSKTNGLKVLAFDYLGTMLGILLFSLYLLPNFTIFKLSSFIALVNLFAVFVFVFFLAIELVKGKWFYGILILFVFIFLGMNNYFFDFESLVLTNFYYR
jgi:spermidine synthase